MSLKLNSNFIRNTRVYYTIYVRINKKQFLRMRYMHVVSIEAESLNRNFYMKIQY
jgi:hypothetical protein